MQFVPSDVTRGHGRHIKPLTVESSVKISTEQIYSLFLWRVGELRPHWSTPGKLRLDKVSYRISWLFSMSLPDKHIHTLRIYSSYQEAWVINNLSVSAIQFFHKTYDGELEISNLLRRDLGIAMITWMHITWHTLCFMGSHPNRATLWPFLLSPAIKLFLKKSASCIHWSFTAISL